MDVAGGGGLGPPGRDQRRAIYIHGDGNIGIQGNGTYKYSSNTIHPITKRMKVAYVQRYGSKRSFNLHFRGISIKRVTEGK